MYSTSKPIPELIGDIIDTIRQTGVVGVITYNNPLSTIESVNTLINGEIITIDSVDYRIKNVTDVQFDVIGDLTGLEGEVWKAKAPYYEYGHMLEIAQKLGEKDKGKDTYKYQKYPLIALRLDLPEDRQSILSVMVRPTFYLIQNTEKEYYAEQRIANIFTPVLDPLHEKFIDALSYSVLTDTNSQILHDSTRRLYWGRVLPDYNEAVQMNDLIDAIELNGMDLVFAVADCSQ